MQVLQHHADKVGRLQPGNWVQFLSHSVLWKDEKNQNAERKINLYSAWSVQIWNMWREGIITASNMGKVVVKRTLISFSAYIPRCRLIISCENSYNMICKEPPECQYWDICLKWFNNCPVGFGKLQPASVLKGLSYLWRPLQPCVPRNGWLRAALQELPAELTNPQMMDWGSEHPKPGQMVYWGFSQPSASGIMHVMDVSKCSMYSNVCCLTVDFVVVKAEFGSKRAVLLGQASIFILQPLLTWHFGLHIL